jgi:Protein of unknown function (DUF2630)
MRRMSDESIAQRIDRLVAEERQLRSKEAGDAGEALEADAARLRAIEVELDVCWDLLRQRRALRDAGEEPDRAGARSPDTVERYWQ